MRTQADLFFRIRNRGTLEDGNPMFNEIAQSLGGVIWLSHLTTGRH